MENILILIVSIIAGISTYAISNILKKGTVFASAIVTLISGIVFPYFFPEIGGKLMLVAACASYAGMVSVKHVPKLWEMSIISIMTGCLFIITILAYEGVGGRLGTIAAISCITWIGFKKAIRTIKRQYVEKNLD